jgi:predicted metallopeptidase
MDRVVLSIAKCRSQRCGGVYANIMSLRFPGGAAEVTKNGAVYRLPRIIKNGREALYLVRFYLPRFQDLPLPDKIATILHELHHIDPKFNGCFRSFGGKRWAHGRSQKTFEGMFESLQCDIMKHIDQMTDLFLNCRFTVLLQRFGDVYGDRYASITPYEDRFRVLT